MEAIADECPTSMTVQPRGLRREQAALYIGISPSKFDNERKAGRIPEPKTILPGVAVWDRSKLDELFFDDPKPLIAANDNNEWDTVH